jgi:hypothetical protein
LCTCRSWLKRYCRDSEHITLLSCFSDSRSCPFLHKVKPVVRSKPELMFLIPPRKLVVKFPWHTPVGYTKGSLFSDVILDENGVPSVPSHYCSICNSLTRGTKGDHEISPLHQKGSLMVKQGKQLKMASGTWRKCFGVVSSRSRWYRRPYKYIYICLYYIYVCLCMCIIMICYDGYMYVFRIR